MKEEKHNCAIDWNKTKANIKEYGLSVFMIEATDYLPSFGYSVGLKETYNHPEIIVFGLSTQLSHEIINDVAWIIKEEGKIDIDREYTNIFQNSRAKFLKVDSRSIDDYFGIAIKYYNTSDFDALQLVWTDRNDKFPWEDGFEEEFKFVQPLLDRNAEFKFREEKNCCVITTSQWLEDNEPIISVAHDEDGYWQFLTEEVDFDDAKVVNLEQMILSDLTLNEVFDLEYGEIANRDFVGGKWTISKLEE